MNFTLIGMHHYPTAYEFPDLLGSFRMLEADYLSARCAPHAGSLRFLFWAEQPEWQLLPYLLCPDLWYPLPFCCILGCGSDVFD